MKPNKLKKKIREGHLQLSDENNKKCVNDLGLTERINF